MTTVPHNLTLIREDSRNPGTLSQLKARMEAAPTDYVMVVGENDIVDVPGILDGDVHYLATHVATRRAFRLSRPVLGFDPVLLIQFNYLGRPILHRSLMPLFPGTAVEPWHTFMVRAHLQGAGFSLVTGDHTIIEAWPRPERSGAYSRYGYSFDPAAVMEAVPTVLVQEIDQKPVYTLRNPRAESITAFCCNCSMDFVGSLAAPNVSVQILGDYDHGRLLAAQSNYVAWFDGIEESCGPNTLNQLLLGLEFPGVEAISPRLVTEFSLETYHYPAFSSQIGLSEGLDPDAWLVQQRELGLVPPSDGYVNNQAILRKIS